MLSTGALAVIAACGSLLAISLLTDEGGITDATIGILKVQSAKAADAAAPPTTAQAAIETVARAAMATQLERANASAGPTHEYAVVNGHTVTADDLQLMQSTFVPSVAKVTSATGAMFTTGVPFDAWVVVFQAQDVPVPAWGAHGLLESVVVVEDGTIRVRSSGVRLVNPAAVAPPSVK